MAAASSFGGHHPPQSVSLKAGTVLIRHHHKHHVRIHPQEHSKADAEGGSGCYAQWSMEVHGHNVVKFKSMKSGQYLRIVQKGTVCDVNGCGGKYTLFKYDPIRRSLESQQFPGCYLAVNPQHKSRSGVFAVHKSGAQNPQSDGFAFDFNILSVSKRSPVVIQHGFGKSLRVNPEDEGKICGHGGKGKFARWTVQRLEDPFNGVIVRIRSLKSGKALRVINKGMVVDVKGGAGPFTDFKYDASRKTLESVRFPGTFLAVHKNGKCVVAVRPEAMKQDGSVSLQFGMIDVEPKACGNGHGPKRKKDDMSMMIESQRTLINQQQRLINQLQKTVDAQQVMIGQLTAQQQGPGAQTNMDSNGEWEEDEFHHVTIPGAAKK